VSRVIDPHIDALKMMHSKSDRTIDFFTITHIAGERQGLVELSDAGASCFYAAGVSRQQHHTRTLLDEELCDGLADPHGSASDDCHFA